ncbi:MAG: FAD-dependent oxidoreductase [Pseudomonadota bacterium]
MRIGIVGGGIAGLTCALALSRSGHKVTLHERAPVLEEVGAGIQLSPNATKPLFELGLSSALNAVASAPRSIDMYAGHSSVLIASIPLGPEAERRYGAPYYVIHRADLQRTLAEACAKEPNLKICLGSQIGVVHTNNSHARVGSDTFDLLIAADGVNSAIRRQHFDVLAQPSGLVAWRTTIPMDERPAFFARERTTLCIAKNTHLVTYPIGSGTELNAVAILPQGTEPEDGFSKWNNKVAQIKDCGEWLAWPLNQVPTLPRWTSGRMVLLGDAAHAMLPFAAQGGASAIEDAVSLAKCIRKSDALSTNLQLWEKQRKKRVESIAALAMRNRWIYHLSGPMALARNMVMKGLGPQRLLAQQDWIYRHQA